MTVLLKQGADCIVLLKPRDIYLVYALYFEYQVWWLLVGLAWSLRWGDTTASIV